MEDEEYFTEEEIAELKRRIDESCKIHDWLPREDEGVFECSICGSMLFTGEASDDLFYKYLL